MGYFGQPLTVVSLVAIALFCCRSGSKQKESISLISEHVSIPSTGSRANGDGMPMNQHRVVTFLFFIVVLCIHGCGSDSAIKGSWNYSQGDEVINLSILRGGIAGESPEVFNHAILHHSIYDAKGKVSDKKSYVRSRWRFEDNILNVYSYDNGIEKTQLKVKVLEVDKRKLITVKFLEVHDELKPMNLVGQTVTLRSPKSITRESNSGRSVFQIGH